MVDSSGQLIPNPPLKQIQSALSIHVLAFSSNGDLLVVESEGEFVMDTWEQVHEMAKNICRGPKPDENNGEDLNMGVDQQASLGEILRDTIDDKMRKEQAWKESTA